MISISVHEAITRLPFYLAEVEKGKTILICKQSRPVAEVRHIEAPVIKPRPIGLAKGTFTLPNSFFDELPEDLTRLFEGQP